MGRRASGTILPDYYFDVVVFDDRFQCGRLPTCQPAGAPPIAAFYILCWYASGVAPARPVPDSALDRCGVRGVMCPNPLLNHLLSSATSASSQWSVRTPTRHGRRARRQDPDVGGNAGIPDVPGARIVYGTGRFLLPGLMDLHTHVSKTRGSSLGLIVAHGVTTVRDLGGDHEELLRWSRRDEAGQRHRPASPNCRTLSGSLAKQCGAAARHARTRHDRAGRTYAHRGQRRRPMRSALSAPVAARGVDHLKIRTVAGSRDVSRNRRRRAPARLALDRTFPTFRPGRSSSRPGSDR